MIEKDNPFQTQFGISFLRILATFSVILIHVSGRLVENFGEIPSLNWNVANFFDSISRYSVPMFFMISGALLLPKDYKLNEFLTKRFGKILPPFLIWSLIYSVLNRYVFKQEVFDISKIVKDIFYGSEYHLWFVYALLGVYLITPLLQKWTKNALQNEVLYFLIIWLITLILRLPNLNIYFPKVDLTYFSGFIGYFVLGFYLSKFKFKKKIISLFLVVIGCLITIFGTYFVSLKNSEFYQYFYDYLSLNTLMVAFGVFTLFNKMDNSNIKANKIVIKLNEACFGVYLIHPLVLKLFILIGFDKFTAYPIINILFSAIACFFLCFAMIFCLKKLKYGYLIA